MKHLQRIYMRTEGEAFNPLMFPFIFFTLVSGLAFTVFGWTATVQASILFSITHVHLSNLATSLWGMFCTLAAVLTILNLMFRWERVGWLAGWVGLLVWVYAFMAYVSFGYIYQALLCTIQVYFWVWHQYRIKRYYFENS